MNQRFVESEKGLCPRRIVAEGQRVVHPYSTGWSL